MMTWRSLFICPWRTAKYVKEALDFPEEGASPDEAEGVKSV